MGKCKGIQSYLGNLFMFLLGNSENQHGLVVLATKTAWRCNLERRQGGFFFANFTRRQQRGHLLLGRHRLTMMLSMKNK